MMHPPSMIKLLPRLALLLALLPGIGWSAAIESLDMSEPAIQINDQNGTMVMDVTYRVPVSPREAWAVLTDFENMPGFVPNLESSRVLLRNGNLIQVEQKGSVRLGLLPIHYESTRQIETTPYQSIRAHTLSGDTRLDSVMALAPAGEGTLLSYHATATTDLPVPNSLVGSYLRNMLESQFKAMGGEMLRRAQLDSDDKGKGAAFQLAQQPAQVITGQAAAKPALRQSRLAPKKIRTQIKKRPG